VDEDEPLLPEGPFSGEGDLEKDDLGELGKPLVDGGDEGDEDVDEGRRACW
jgi:hypothetical protein